MAAIRDYALIGDCRAAALVSSDGAIDWCCLPRFDSGSAFATLLDADAGCCRIAPGDSDSWRTSRRYLEDTLVLETTFTSDQAICTLTDCFLAPDDSTPPFERKILRLLEGKRGQAQLQIRVAPRYDYGQVRPWVRSHEPGVYSVVGGNDGLIVRTNAKLSEQPLHELTGTIEVSEGTRIWLLLSYCPPELLDGRRQPVRLDELDEALAATIDQWREFAGGLERTGAESAGTKRSALVLKALTYTPTGAMIAAPTTSLPEVPGGERNWDYRFAWVRDASFASRALSELGALKESDAFRHFVVRSAAGHADDLQVVYGVGGERRLTLEELPLTGYGNAQPVRIGNGASHQRQLDRYGEVVNLMWRWHKRGRSPDEDDWRFLVSLINGAAKNWAEPDRGIWEWAGAPEHFVHSKVLCWSTLDHGIRMAQDCGHDAPLDHWRKARDQVREAIDHLGFDRRRGIYLQAFGRLELDSALLLLPTVDYIAWDDKRMVRTVAAIREELDAGGGLLYRYRRPDDGLRGQEGVFLCCSFWLVEALAHQGEVAEARSVFERVLKAGNDLGLFSEELDPETGAALGNFPQGLTHLAHISAALALVAAERREQGHEGAPTLVGGEPPHGVL
jgi:GH15 family glucan-1,4-alpha-glucosidase